MSTCAKHYEELLAEHYVWMFGVSFDQKVAEQKALLAPILSPATRHGPAFDLGSGPGFQTIALAELGYSPVIAVDTSKKLLAELRAHSGSHAVETREADLLFLESADLSERAAVIVCMGDTLTHLPSKAAVQTLFTAVFGKLAPDGVFVVTYRDLSRELVGVDRFLPVRADDATILTCFLEYKNDDAVVVNDLLYVRGENGWQLKKSNYEKLRLAQDWVANALRKAGFRIERLGPAGRMVLVVAQKEALK